MTNKTSTKVIEREPETDLFYDDIMPQFDTDYYTVPRAYKNLKEAGDLHNKNYLPSTRAYYKNASPLDTRDDAEDLVRMFVQDERFVRGMPDAEKQKELANAITKRSDAKIKYNQPMPRKNVGAYFLGKDETIYVPWDEWSNHYSDNQIKMIHEYMHNLRYNAIKKGILAHGYGTPFGRYNNLNKVVEIDRRNMQHAMGMFNDDSYTNALSPFRPRYDSNKIKAPSYDPGLLYKGANDVRDLFYNDKLTYEILNKMFDDGLIGAKDFESFTKLLDNQ